MTEREYVEHIKTKAETYIAKCIATNPATDRDAAVAAARGWEHARAFLSPQTTIAMAESWLAAEKEPA